MTHTTDHTRQPHLEHTLEAVYHRAKRKRLRRRIVRGVGGLLAFSAVSTVAAIALGELPTTNEVTTVAGQATEESQSSDSPVPASDIGSAPPTTVAPGETLTLHDLLTDDGVYPRCFVLLGPVGTDTEPTELGMLLPGIEGLQSLRGCRSVAMVGPPTVTIPPLDPEVYELCAYGDPSSCIRFELLPDAP